MAESSLAFLPANLLPANPLVTGGLFLALALVPLLAMSVTSFVKLSVVLGILRNALGAGQLPGGAITALLALVLTMHVMSPVCTAMWGLFQDELSRSETGTAAGPASPGPGAKSAEQAQNRQLELVRWWKSAQKAVEPLRDFLFRFSGEKERRFFSELGRQRGCASTERDLINLIPAFLISELDSAFHLGFMIFLPFLVLDIVVTNLLVGLGMTMVNPVSISLPLKLLLFVSADGWFLLCGGLILSYS